MENLMANTSVFFDEVRINVADPQLTHVYVLVRTEGDAPHMVGGWYYRAYPASITSEEIIKTMWNEDGGVLYWARKAP